MTPLPGQPVEAAGRNCAPEAPTREVGLRAPLPLAEPPQRLMGRAHPGRTQGLGSWETRRWASATDEEETWDGLMVE